MTRNFTETDIQSAVLLVKSGAESLRKATHTTGQPYPDGLIIKTIQTLDLGIKLPFF